ncbi:40-kDa huntingtin-associated protein [Pectinophora gossypiella]|uniref:40-kDa huntingtin-associated protein n=1 Tax=Pectinophora gossypiella TaxID=13191 RepID=UPI00214EE803|nr:40-kDa huntingtin-associated protein [Pectinophora gossypiella]
MSTDLGASFNEQYMNINTKLKKRFMRKPNISEATNEFIALAIQCEHSEQPAFAGHAYVGAAKCEASAGNFLGEAEHYLSAARQFMKAEKKLKVLKFHSPDRENLEAAIGCFMQALSKYPERSPIRTSILMELADGLVSLNHKLEAVSYYEQALELVEDKTRKLMFLRNLLNLQMDCGKFDIALETANTMCDLHPNIPEDILSEVQINRVLLTLVVEPAEEDRPVSLMQLFTNLLSDNESDAIPFNTDVQLKLQSIVLSCATGDVSSLISVAADTRQYLTTQQNDLLDALLKEKRDQHLSLV